MSLDNNDESNRSEEEDNSSANSSNLEDPYNEDYQLQNCLNEIDQNPIVEEGNNDQFDDFPLTLNEPDFDINKDKEEDRNEKTVESICLSTMNVGDVARMIKETIYGGSFGNITISGHVLLNQCGTLLLRGKHQIKGSSRHYFPLQRIVVTTHGSSVPLMYPEGISFPSIHWKIAPNKCSIVGCLPTPLLIESIHGSRFSSIQSHIKSRLQTLLDLLAVTPDIVYTAMIC